MARYKVGYIVGSLAAASINRALSRALIRLAPPELEFVEIPIRDLPLYSYDYDADFPAPARALKQAVASVDAVLFVTPEYNRSIPGALKNAIDWASRPWGDNSFTRKPSAVIGASPGKIGTAIAQQSLRSVLGYCNSPQMNAPEAYIQFRPGLISETGEVGDAGTEQFLRKFMAEFHGFVAQVMTALPRAGARRAEQRRPPAAGEADALVVGAGPVGLMAAHELLRRGIAVRLVDAASGPATTSRAAVIHPRTIEILDQLGLYEEFNARAVQGRGIAFDADGRQLASMDPSFTGHATRFNRMWLLDQAITERLLRSAVERLGGRVEWGVRLTGVERDAGTVRATLDHDGRVEETTAPWLVGCDGGHSTVREQLGVVLKGESTETWLIADAEIDFARPVEHDRIRWIRADGASMMLFPLVGERRWRLLDTVDVDYGGDDDAVAERFARKLSRGLGTEARVERPTWVSVFTIQQRAAPVMQSDRCFLAGDAAHVHSPASGQGLNTGVQDAFNLAWKLAAVIRGLAGPSLLDTYSAERVPVGKALLRSTRTATELVELRNAVIDEHLPAVFEVANAWPPIFQALNRSLFGAMSGLGIAYRTSPLTVPDTDTLRPGPAPGERVVQVRHPEADTAGWRKLFDALRGPSWLLVTADQTTGGQELSLPSLAQTCAVGRPASDTLGLEDGGWLLVRPDGYVAARGHGQDQLNRAHCRMPL
ncbi:FAD-dependent oxidoreductase [Dactylosporangium sp. CA-152071]|uniref:FAD-dependent oxidoreductase n=1 Tax=Dactylosporangium sp. CA-152071 TaxID=3239933 RepID=UPI003D93C880